MMINHTHGCETAPWIKSSSDFQDGGDKANWLKRNVGFVSNSMNKLHTKWRVVNSQIF